MEIKDIIQGILEENPRSQKALVDQYAPYLFSICRRYLRDDLEAQDVLQDTFMRVFKSMDKFSGEVSSFKPWIKRIAINIALKKIKLFSYTRETYPDDAMPIVSAPAAAHDSMGVDEIMGLLEQLTPDQKKVFNLYIIDGYSHKEIASELGVEVATSRSILLRARNTMQHLIIKRDSYEAKAI